MKLLISQITFSNSMQIIRDHAYKLCSLIVPEMSNTFFSGLCPYHLGKQYYRQPKWVFCYYDSHLRGQETFLEQCIFKT